MSNTDAAKWSGFLCHTSHPPNEKPISHIEILIVGTPVGLSMLLSFWDLVQAVGNWLGP
jgi:hypothetical protein